MSDSESSVSSYESEDTIITVKEKKQILPDKNEQTDLIIHEESPKETIDLKKEEIQNDKQEIISKEITLKEKKPILKIFNPSEIPSRSKKEVTFIPLPETSKTIEVNPEITSENLFPVEEPQEPTNIIPIESDEQLLKQIDQAIEQEVKQESAQIVEPEIITSPIEPEKKEPIVEIETKNQTPEIIPEPELTKELPETEIPILSNIISPNLEKTPINSFRSIDVKNKFQLLQQEFDEIVQQNPSLENQSFKFVPPKNKKSNLKLPNLQIRFQLLELFIWGSLMNAEKKLISSSSIH